MLGLMHFLLVTALTIPTGTLVLRNGHRIDVDGTVRVEAGRVLFRSAGALYSVAEDEVDFDATRAAAMTVAMREEKPGRLRVTPEEKERLLKELEQNHNGTPASPEALRVPPGPSTEERQQATQDEWSWKRQARSYEEAVRQARENLDMLRDKAAALRAHIAGLLTLGYTPGQFTFDTTQLHYTEEQIPLAELEVQRAQRAYEQFRDEARRRDVPPGYLR